MMIIVLSIVWLTGIPIFFVIVAALVANAKLVNMDILSVLVFSVLWPIVSVVILVSSIPSWLTRLFECLVTYFKNKKEEQDHGKNRRYHW